MPRTNERKNKVLIIEDDAGIRESLFETLSALGFAVGEACNGEEGLMRLGMTGYDAVLLDINMPGMGGKEACRRIVQLNPQLPIIMLTVRDEVADIVETLDAGASDYVTKPFQMAELMARLRSAIRRVGSSSTKTPARLTVGDISLDPYSHRVTKGETEVHLTPKEFSVLHFLMERAGRLMRHDVILRSVWGQNYGNEREYLRVIINQLRKKLEDDSAQPVYILTESHVGYRFRAE